MKAYRCHASLDFGISKPSEIYIKVSVWNLKKEHTCNLQRGLPLNLPGLIFSSGWMVTPALGSVMEADAKVRAVAPAKS